MPSSSVRVEVLASTAETSAATANATEARPLRQIGPRLVLLIMKQLYAY